MSESILNQIKVNQQNINQETYEKSRVINKNVESIDKEIKQLEEELRLTENNLTRLRNTAKTEERRIRTKRLIERGAILECLIPNSQTIPNEELKELLKNILSTSFAIEKIKEINTSENGRNIQ